PATGEPAVPRQDEPARPILTRPPAAPESAADRTPGVAVASAEAVEPDSDPGAPLPVRIEIGRVEIHAARSSEPARTPRPATTRRSAAMSLEAYLASKGGQT
ncbi:MAG: hypothetical protein V2I24_03920, partial [Halieaceae bacterium]|nr:hypothetical protein [Halieaceae bacterium]